MDEEKLDLILDGIGVLIKKIGYYDRKRSSRNGWLLLLVSY